MSDSSILAILFFLVALLVGSYCYVLFMLKTSMDELEYNLGLHNFFCNIKPNAVVCGGKYRGLNISIENEASFKSWKEPAHTTYTLEYSPKILAEILPGRELFYEEEQIRARMASEEAAKKVWHAKLTKEEQKIIEERRAIHENDGEDDSEDDSEDETPFHETIRVVSSKPNEVDNYLDEKGRRQALVELFKSGVVRINMGFDEVTMECVAGNYNDYKTMKYDEKLRNLYEVCVDDEIL